MAKNKSLFKFKSAKITYPEMISNKGKIVVKDCYPTSMIFAKKRDIGDSTLIYSQWEGYLQKNRGFWNKNNVPIIQVHTSGHAFVEELQSFVSAVKPKCIIPNHTFNPNEFKDLFRGTTVKVLKDNEILEL